MTLNLISAFDFAYIFTAIVMASGMLSILKTEV